MITIGQLIAALEAAEPDASVFFDFGSFAPTDLDSSRGYYEQAALGYREHLAPTARHLANELRQALALTYHGYKGGEYHYTEDTPLWVDNYGCWTETEITHVTACYYRVTIHTQQKGAGE